MRLNKDMSTGIKLLIITVSTLSVLTLAWMTSPQLKETPPTQAEINEQRRELLVQAAAGHEPKAENYAQAISILGRREQLKNMTDEEFIKATLPPPSDEWVAQQAGKRIAQARAARRAALNNASRPTPNVINH